MLLIFCGIDKQIMLQRAKENPKVKILCNAIILNWRGDKGVLNGLRYKDTITGSEQEVQCTRSH